MDPIRLYDSNEFATMQVRCDNTTHTAGSHKKPRNDVNVNMAECELSLL